MFGVDQLHPIFVHFPVALVLLGGATALLWLFTGTALWRQVSAVLFAAGALGALAAYTTGQDMAEAFAERAAVKLLGERHEDFGLWALLSAAVAAGAFLAAGLSQSRCDLKGYPGPDRKPLQRALCAVVALAAAALVAYTGHLGGLMTWGRF